MTRACKTSIALVKSSYSASLSFIKFVALESRLISISCRSKGSSGFTMADLRFMYSSLSKLFFLVGVGKIHVVGMAGYIKLVAEKRPNVLKVQDSLASVHQRDRVLGH